MSSSSARCLHCTLIIVANPCVPVCHHLRRLQADDQFQTALRTHLQNMDKLIDLQDSRLLALEQEFEAELETLQGVGLRPDSRRERGNTVVVEESMSGLL